MLPDSLHASERVGERLTVFSACCDFCVSVVYGF
jgi:hypothetical protein